MRLRGFQPGDTPALIELFRSTVFAVNRRDYSAAQLSAWAPEEIDPAAWAARQADNMTLVAESEGRIVGSADDS